MSEDATAFWDTDAFDILSYCYFNDMDDEAEDSDLEDIGFAGDSLLLLALPSVDNDGRIIMPPMDKVVLGASLLNFCCSIRARAWEDTGLKHGKGEPRRTRTGGKFGPVTIGDALVRDQNAVGKCLEFDARKREIFEQEAPGLMPSSTEKHKIPRGIHLLSPTANWATRALGCGDIAPELICILTADDVKLLNPHLRQRYRRILPKPELAPDHEDNRVTFKGIGKLPICGMIPPSSEKELLELVRLSKAYYQRHATYTH